jgi:hypothetical protein
LPLDVVLGPAALPGLSPIDRPLLALDDGRTTAEPGGLVDLLPERTAELDRLLGGSGHDALSRLGLPPEAASEIGPAALAALQAWRRLAEHLLSNGNVQLQRGRHAPSSRASPWP